MRPGAEKLLTGSLVGLLLLTGAFFYFSNNISDPDLWGHLKFGGDIYRDRAVQRYDTYSDTTPGAPWINHEWLSELIFYALYSSATSTGLILFKVFIGMAIIILLYLSVRGRIRSKSLALGFMLTSLAVINYGFLSRPQIFTYLGFALFCFLIQRYETKERLLYLWPLVPLSLVWANLHGGFIAGMAFLAAYLAFKLASGKAVKELTIIVLLSILATFVNPYGKELWSFLFKSLSQPRPHISEWQKIRLVPFYSAYFAVVLTAAAGMFFSKAKKPPFTIFAIAAGIAASFFHNRHMVLSVIIIATHAPSYIDVFSVKGLTAFERKVPKWLARAGILCLCVYFAAMAPYKGEGNPLKIKIPQRIYPLDAVRFLKDNGITGNIFPFFNWSQVCISELSGKSRVFFDGRYRTVYEDRFIRDYFDVLYGRKDYRSHLEGFPETDIMLLHRDNALSFDLLKDSEWVQVYDTPIARVFLKNNEHNSAAIEAFKRRALIRPAAASPVYWN